MGTGRGYRGRGWWLIRKGRGEEKKWRMGKGRGIEKKGRDKGEGGKERGTGTGMEMGDGSKHVKGKVQYIRTFSESTYDRRDRYYNYTNAFIQCVYTVYIVCVCVCVCMHTTYIDNMQCTHTYYAGVKCERCCVKYKAQVQAQAHNINGSGSNRPTVPLLQ